MGYYNPIYSYGLVPFAERCQQVGVDGLIAVDLPGFEAAPLLSEYQARDISMIPLLAPTSTDESIKEACSGATGFVYCISVTGVTGVRNQVSTRSFDLLDRVKSHTDLPLAVGFGISNRSHVIEVGKTADAAIVGSALIRVMLDSPREELVQRASRFVAELAGGSLPA
jgi:tryptophan synthase alpha subunit